MHAQKSVHYILNRKDALYTSSHYKCGIQAFSSHSENLGAGAIHSLRACQKTAGFQLKRCSPPCLHPKPNRSSEQRIRFGEEEQRNERTLTFEKSRSKRYAACSDVVDDTRLELVTSRTSSGCATSCANRPHRLYILHELRPFVKNTDKIYLMPPYQSAVLTNIRLCMNIHYFMHILF